MNTFKLKKNTSLRIFVGIALISVVGSQFQCVKKIAIKAVSKALSGESGTVFSGDNDPELVGDALPFAIKTYESLLAQNPKDTKLLLATGKALCTYGYLFVQIPADRLPDEQLDLKTSQRLRAKRLYMRSRDYLISALESRHKGIKKSLLQGTAEAALSECTLKDTSILYWSGMAWMAAVSIDKFDLSLALTTPTAVACISKSMALCDSFSNGSAHDFFISYYGSLPASMGGSIQKAEAHFEKSLQYAHGMRVAPYIALATSVCVKAQDQQRFTTLLESALALNPDTYIQYRLSNITGQEQARWLLAHTSDYFLDTKDILAQ